MRSLRTRIEVLEKATRRVSPSRQLDLFLSAMHGDSASLEKLRQLRRDGIIGGCMDELADAILTPLQGQQPGDGDDQFAAEQERPTC